MLTLWWCEAKIVAMEVTKVIFLDFDGPMIPFRNWVLAPLATQKYEKFDPIAVATILAALTNSGAKLVISSSWREIGYDEICKVLEMNGISKDCLHQDWATANLVDHSMADRPIEIRAWLFKHSEIQKYVVIDDAKMEIDNLVHVTSEDGILYKHQLEIFKLLGAPLSN
jgi:hypothetical protein